MAPSPTPSAHAAPRTPIARVVKSRHLFYALLRRLQPATILDIGSRDGSDALAFRAAAPGSRILAFEAHPQLAERMRADPRLAAAQIEVHPFAVSNRNGEASFSILSERKQLGSLREPGETPATDALRVPTRRLDEFAALGGAGRLALWIDVEGSSYEVVEGAEGILDRVLAIHAEVEWEPLWEGQRLADELSALLSARGFETFFTGVKRSGRQGNVVYLRRDLSPRPGRAATLARALAYRLART